MTRRRLWRAAASIFTLLNLGGAGFAAVSGESLHAALHLALMIPGVYLVWRLAPPPGREELSRLSSTEERLELLQQSVDAIAIEVERIGEAQRYSEKLQGERVDTRR